MWQSVDGKASNLLDKILLFTTVRIGQMITVMPTRYKMSFATVPASVVQVTGTNHCHPTPHYLDHIS